MILLMKYFLTPDCSRAVAVPATQQTSPDPAFFSAPDSTHYREYSLSAKSGTPRFQVKCARPLSFMKAGSGNEITECFVIRMILMFLFIDSGIFQMSHVSCFAPAIFLIICRCISNSNSICPEVSYYHIL